MKTNDTFTISRMGASLKLVLTERRKSLLLASGTLFGCLAACSSVFPWMFDAYAVAAPIDTYQASEIHYFMFIFALFMAISGSMFYSAINGKDARIRSLTLPASNSEKFGSYFIVYSVIAVAAFVLLGFAADYVRVLTARLYAAEGAVVNPVSLRFIINCGIPDLPGTHDMSTLVLTLFLSMSAVGNGLFVLGSAVWSRRGFMKTFITSFVLWIVMIFTSNAGFRIMFPNGNPMPRFDMSIDGTCLMIGCSAAVLTAILYWISYVRFKEAEIINRW